MNGPDYKANLGSFSKLPCATQKTDYKDTVQVSNIMCIQETHKIESALFVDVYFIRGKQNEAQILAQKHCLVSTRDGDAWWRNGSPGEQTMLLEEEWRGEGTAQRAKVWGSDDIYIDFVISFFANFTF